MNFSKRVQYTLCIIKFIATQARSADLLPIVSKEELEKVDQPVALSKRRLKRIKSSQVMQSRLLSNISKAYEDGRITHTIKVTSTVDKIFGIQAKYNTPRKFENSFRVRNVWL